ncbi:MAG: hypothetical protein NC420_04660 [Eubacterium sp.]|nr:hypothetical protein [Eubacterium sp.]
MINLKNFWFDQTILQVEDIFIGAIGYENRSEYMFKQICKKIDSNNILLFYFDDYSNFDRLKNEIDDIKTKYKMIERKYEEGDKVINDIISFLEEKDLERTQIHVDYSSMPRNWYCNMPMGLHKLYPQKVIFWYVRGTYPQNYEVYPSSGIETYNIIGIATLRSEQKRMHVIGLGYDVIRTKALLSIMDPDLYSVCSVHDDSAQDIGDNVQKMNFEIISQAFKSIDFNLDDVSFIYSKLCEMANEYNPIGDIIFVPDGPKPLIMAMALVPQTIAKPGISCLLVSRNKSCYEPIMVEPTNKIIGFGIYDDEGQQE